MSYGNEMGGALLSSREINQLASPGTVIEMGSLLAQNPQPEVQEPRSWRGRFATKAKEQTTRLGQYLYNNFGPIKAITDFSIASADAFNSYVVRPLVWVGKKIHQAYQAASFVTKQDVDNFCEDTWIRARTIGKGVAVGAATGGLAGVGASVVFSPTTGASSLIASPFLVGLGAGMGAGFGAVHGSSEGAEAVAQKREERNLEAQKLRVEHQGHVPTSAKEGTIGAANTEPPPPYNFDYVDSHQPVEVVIV